WDLVGAGLGALVIVPLLRFPAPVLLVALGVVACGAAALFAGPSAARMLRRRIGTIAGAGVALIAVAAVIPVLYLPMPPLQRDALLVDTWHPLSRVQALQLPGAPVGLVFYDRVYAPVPHVSGDHLPDWRGRPRRPAAAAARPRGGSCSPRRPSAATTPAPAVRRSSAAAGAGTSTTPSPPA